MFGLCMRKQNLLFVDLRDVEWRLGLRKFWLDMSLHILILLRRGCTRKLLRRLLFLMRLLGLRMEGIFCVLLMDVIGGLLGKVISKDMLGVNIKMWTSGKKIFWSLMRWKTILALVQRMRWMMNMIQMMIWSRLLVKTMIL